MEATKLVEALGTLRENFEKPPSDMEIVRRAVLAQVSRDGGLEMPPILNEDQRKAFSKELDYVEGFLKSEDGADSIELLCNAFTAYVAACKEAEAAGETETEGEEGNPGKY